MCNYYCFFFNLFGMLLIFYMDYRYIEQLYIYVIYVLIFLFLFSNIWIKFEGDNGF